MAVDLKKEKRDAGSLVKWFCTLGVPLMILLLPVSEAFSRDIKIFLAITVAAIMSFAFENIDQTLVAILLPGLYIICKLAPSAVVLSPWTQNIPWMVLGGFLLADTLGEIGLLKRVAYKCIIWTGCTYNGILYGLVIAGVLLNFMVPGKLALPFAALSYGICTALELGKSKESAGIMLAAAMGALMPPQMFAFNPTFFILVNGGLEATGPLELSWWGFFFNNAVGIVFILFMTFVASRVFKPAAPISGKVYFRDEYKKLGGMSSKEKKAIVVVLALFLALITNKWHGVDAGWCFALIPLVMFFPGVNIGTKETIAKVNYRFIIFVASCMTIGSTAGALGLGKLVANMVMPVLEGRSTTFVLMFVWALCVALNFLLTPLAVMSAFALPLGQIAVDLGINPLAMYFTMTNGLEQLLMPYEVALYLIFFSFGLIELKYFTKFLGLKMIFNGVFVCLILIPYWNLVGFI